MVTHYASVEEWRAEAVRRFGEDPMNWKFCCPVCKYVASVAEWKACGATEGEVAYSCVGRHGQEPRKAFGGEGSGPCNYAGGGLFRLNPVSIEGHKANVFAFADVK